MAHRSDEELLRSAWRSLAGVQGADGWQVIPARGGSRTYAGVRLPGGSEGLLVGFNVDLPAPRDLPDGRGFSVERLGQSVAPGYGHWLVLTRRPTASLDMFGLMAADLLGTTEAARASSPSDESKLCAQFIARVRSWQRFMEKPSDGRLTADEEVGLFGELLFLERCLDAGIELEAMLDLWLGPQNGLRDFMGGDFAVEVKSTVAVNGFPSRIASLEQLDNADVADLRLVAQRLALQEAGSTLPAKVAAMRQRVDAALAETFERRLRFAGYADAHEGFYTRRFALADVRAFEIDAAFPRLSRSTTHLAVRDAEYVLDLDLVGIPAVAVETVVSLIAGRI